MADVKVKIRNLKKSYGNLEVIKGLQIYEKFLQYEQKRS